MKIENVQFVCGFMGESEYTIWENGKKIQVAYKYSWSDYERSIFNGDEKQWTRDVLGKLYKITPTYYRDRLTQKHVDIMRNYFQQQNDNFLAEMKRKAKIDPIYNEIFAKEGPSTPLVKGGAYWDNGWKDID